MRVEVLWLVCTRLGHTALPVRVPGHRTHRPLPGRTAAQRGLGRIVTPLIGRNSATRCRHYGSLVRPFRHIISRRCLLIGQSPLPAGRAIFTLCRAGHAIVALAACGIVLGSGLRRRVGFIIGRLRSRRLFTRPGRPGQQRPAELGLTLKGPESEQFQEGLGIGPSLLPGFQEAPRRGEVPAAGQHRHRWLDIDPPLQREHRRLAIVGARRQHQRLAGHVGHRADRYRIDEFAR